MKANNYNCDGAHCVKSNSEVRRLDLGGGAGLFLCRACFEHEIRYRKQRNKELGTFAQFDLPTWDDLRKEE